MKYHHVVFVASPSSRIHRAYEDRMDDCQTSFQNRWVQAFIDRPESETLPVALDLNQLGIYEVPTTLGPTALHFWDADLGSWTELPELARDLAVFGIYDPSKDQNPSPARRADELAQPIFDEVMERLRKESSFGAHLDAEQRETTIQCIVSLMTLLMGED